MSTPIEYCAPQTLSGELDTLCAQLAAHTAEPFSSERIESLHRLSQALLAEPSLKATPHAAAVGFWLRKSSLEALKQRFFTRSTTPSPVARGLVFHLVPGNVDTLFIYSWAIAYLCGNASIIRLSRHRTPVIEKLIQLTNDQMQNDAALRDANAFIRYAHEDAITAALSAHAQARLIWGGDATIATIQRFPLPEGARDLAFADRNSFALLDAQAVLALNDGELSALAEKFFRDAFPFDQLACSSPHAMYWIGNAETCTQAAARFDDALETTVKQRIPLPDPALALNRRNEVFALLAENTLRADVTRHGFISLRTNQPELANSLRIGKHTFIHTVIPSWETLLPHLSSKHQSAACFGLSEDARMAFTTEAMARGVARVVDIGEALAFSEIWDGYDIPQELVRES